ncbi:MAG: ROK family protein [Patescibacteria group bacterium]|jgi:glucokinase
MAKKYAIGVDIGGTKIQAALILGHRVIKRFRVPTEAKRGREVILSNIARAIKEVWTPKVGFIGIGIAGLVNHEKGVFVEGPNFPRSFRQIPLARLIKAKFGVPARVDNDVRCFTLGETLFGAAKSRLNVIGLTIGTGIGGGIVLAGRVYRGRDNAAGELGHTIVDLSSKASCSCGRVGHFEALAAGPAIMNLFKKRTSKWLLATDIEKLAKKGDHVAAQTLTEASERLGIGVASIVQALNPDIVVIGGGVSRVRSLWPNLIRTFKKSVTFPILRSTPIVPARLGDDANVIGAALLQKQP